MKAFIEVQFGPWKCIVRFYRYATNMRTAIQLIDAEDAEPVCTATTNLIGFDLPEGYVLIKNWAENEGILDVLIKAGIISDTQQKVPTGFVHADMCKLLIDPEEY